MASGILRTAGGVAILTKALRIQFLTDRTDASLPSLTLLELQVQLFLQMGSPLSDTASRALNPTPTQQLRRSRMIHLQVDDVQTRRRRRGHILNPELAILRPLPSAVISRSVGSSVVAKRVGFREVGEPRRQDGIQDVLRLRRRL